MFGHPVTEIEIPLRKETRRTGAFNFDDSNQVKKAFAPENHQWLTAKENLSKGVIFDE